MEPVHDGRAGDLARPQALHDVDDRVGGVVRLRGPFARRRPGELEERLAERDIRLGIGQICARAAQVGALGVSRAHLADVVGVEAPVVRHQLAVETGRAQSLYQQ